MTKYFTSILSIALSISCTSETITQAGHLDNIAGASFDVGGTNSAGEPNIENGGAINGTGASPNGGTVENGGNGNGGDNGSGGNDPTSGGTSANGGTTGSYGGANVGGATTGIGGSTCVPKTCAETIPAWKPTDSLSKPTACGTTTDGCGGILQCGACVSDGTMGTGCGEAPLTCGAQTSPEACTAAASYGCILSSTTGTCYGNTDWSGYGLIPVANVCGTRCIVDSKSVCGTNDTGKPIRCPSAIPPLGFTGCTVINNTAHTWCCDA